MRAQPAHRASGGPRTPSDRAAKVRFRRALALMSMTLLLPGSAQLVAGNRAVGRWAVRISVTLFAGILGVLIVGYFWSGLFLWLGTTLWVLTWVRVLLMVLAVGWAALFIDAWRLGRPLSLRPVHRRWLIGINGGLAITVAAALFFGSHLVNVQRDLVETVFAGSKSEAAAEGRFNVLLIGADSGKSRWGMRTDSLTVASIDAETGKTVLIGLPRNLANFPFADGSVMAAQFPSGFDCDGCMLNGVSTWAGGHAKLFKGRDNPGLEATISAVEGVTDLDISYHAMVDLEGFKGIVDAVGGVTINVRDELPVGLPSDEFYTTLEPGKQKLNGFELLWYARSRDSSDDYSRMARQKCVMNAMVQQLSPTEVIKHYQSLAGAAGATVTTSIPPSEVDLFASLAMKAKEQKIGTVSLVPPMIDTADPDMDVIHSAIEKAIDKSESGAGGQPKKAKKQTTTGGSYGSRNEGYLANQTGDLSKSC